MTFFDQARAVYDREECARTFDEDFYLHLQYGFVFSSPDGFIMGRPVARMAREELVRDPGHIFATPDTWLVYLAAGSVKNFWRHLPYPLPFVGWERSNVLRFYPSDRVRKACSTLSFPAIPVPLMSGQTPVAG